MYQPTKHGVADYGKFAQLNIPQIIALTGQEGLDADSYDNANGRAKYAQLVYQINPVPLTLSGDVSVDNVKIEGYDAAYKVGVGADHKMWVIDASLISAVQSLTSNISDVELSIENLSGYILNATDTYSRIIQTRGTDIYLAHAPIGTSDSTSGWRVQKVDNDGSRSWYDSGQFSAPANIELSGLSYAY